MLQEEEILQQVTEAPDRAEYYLESLLADAFKGKGFQKISEVLQEKDVYPQKYSKQLLNQLDKILKKELDRNEFSNVSLLLKCIQLYCRSDPQEGVNLLLQQGLIPKMVTWFERTREFLSLIEPKEGKFLARLVEDFFDTVLIIGKSSAEGKKQLLESFIPYLGHIAIECNVNCALRQEALRTLNTLLNNVAREERKKFVLSEEMCSLTKELAKMILHVGDYDIQVAILEALFRLTLKKWRDDLVHNWFEDKHTANAFKEIKDRDFETDCRKFLNELNERLEDNRRVFSFPCKAAYADTNKLTKPADEKLEEFWIDFNCGSESVTFYLNSPESVLWESVRLPNEEVSSYCVQEEEGEKILKMLLQNPTTINKKEVTKIKIHFDSKFDISSPLSIISGRDEMPGQITLEKAGTNNSGDQPQQNGFVLSSHAEGIKDSAGTDSLSNISGSHQSDESVSTTKMATPVDVTAVDKRQQTGKEHSSPAQASMDTAAVSLMHSAATLKTPSLLKPSPLKQKDKTVVSNEEGESDIQHQETLTVEDNEKGRTRHSSKERTEAKKDAYEFDDISDAVAHSMVAEMKHKVFVQKTPLHRSLEKGTVELQKTKKQSASYKNHLFSESNHETPSNSTSERSWIINSQQKSGSKTVNYTRRRPKVRSNLKVLPLSSPSSSSDHHATKAGNSSTPREMAKKRRKQSTRIQNFLAAQQTGITSTPLAHGNPNGLEMADATLPLSGTSSLDDSGADVSKKCDATPSTLLLKDLVSKSKRRLTGFQNGLSDKRLKATERKNSNEQSSSLSFEPKKLFDSMEVEEEMHEGETIDALEDDVSHMFQEGVGDSGIIAAFETFTDQLKKTFWSRYKRIEIYAQNTLKVPEQNMSALLNQIHQCRLKELENFHQMVVKELDNLEKRTQFLSSLEKDTVEFWTKQSNKLNSKLNAFCAHQMQRTQSMGPEPDGTAVNLKEAAQKVKFGKIIKLEEEKDRAFIVASD